MIVTKYYFCVSGSVLSLLYCFVFVSTPVCRNGAGRQVYSFIVLSSSGSLVLSGMCFAVDHFYCWFVTSTPFRGLACIFNRACTAACCPLPHLEAEQVIFLETVAFCPLPIERLSSSPEYWIWNKPLYLNPRSVSELFGPNPHMLTATEARSVTIFHIWFHLDTLFSPSFLSVCVSGLGLFIIWNGTVEY